MRRPIVLGILTLLAVGLWPATSRTPHAASPSASRGESVTLLSDGRWLIVGGDDRGRPVSTAVVQDPATGVMTALPNGLQRARSWHTATVLPDGRVAIVGGVDGQGRVVSEVETFDPTTSRFEMLEPSALTPRAAHTATLLTNGRVLFTGGQVEDGATLDTLELWDPDTGQVEEMTPRLRQGRARHIATLLPDGRVLLWGGVDAAGRALIDGDVVDVVSAQVIAAAAIPQLPGASHPPQVAESIPADGATDVPIDVRLAVRLSKPIRGDALTEASVRLTGPAGVETARVVLAEAGRLLFVSPSAPLLAGSRYTLWVDPIADVDGLRLAQTAISFTTAPPTTDIHAGTATGNHGAIHPAGSQVTTPLGAPVELDDFEWKGERRDGKPHSRWQELPPLEAPPGVTALAGQVLQLNGEPLANVTLQVGSYAATSDRSGRFLLAGIPAGHQKLLMNGSTANRRGVTFGVFDYAINLTAGRTTVLPFTIWIPRLDTQHATPIPVPTTQDMVLRTPRVPGLEAHIPAGMVLRTASGQPLTSMPLTRIPVDRTPYPIPAGTTFFFTPQAHASMPEYRDGTPHPGNVRFILPNVDALAPGVRVNLGTYDSEKYWRVYGQGTVTADGRQIVPDPGVALRPVTCASLVGLSTNAPPSGPKGDIQRGDPVNVATGLFVVEKTDLAVSDVTPIALTRLYRPNDDKHRGFGPGGSHAYQMYLVGDGGNYIAIDLVLGDGRRLRYNRISPGGMFLDAVLEHTGSPGRFFKSRLVGNNTRGGWDLTLVDGTLYQFTPGKSWPTVSPGPHVMLIRDRYGNTVTLNRLTNNLLTRVTSPNGQVLDFTYDQTADYYTAKILQARDSVGRTVSYGYDGGGRLVSVTDAGGGVTQYTYDANGRMATIRDARGIVYLTNEYDAAGRVTRQTHADGTTYQFAYTLDPNGWVAQADVTDPRGTVERFSFNQDGFALTTTRAFGTALAQTTSITRQAGTNLATSITDALGRRTDYAYSAYGKPTSMTRLAGTPSAVSTTFTYEATFQQLATVTDPLNHMTTFGYDAAGNVTSAANPLGQATTFTYNPQGQPLTVTTPPGTTMLAYDQGELVSITDTLGNMTARFADSVGRLAGVRSPGGQLTRYEYSALNLLTKISDPLGAVTQLGYDPNGNLLSVTDARGNVTSYTYTTMDRRATRMDPLGRTESYGHDGNGNVTSVTDRKGQVTTKTYDALDRLTLVTYQDGSTTSYTYDAGDRVTQITDSVGGTITRTSDGLDRLTQETTPEGSVSYTYDAAGRRTSMTVAGQPTVTYAYDIADRMTQVSQGAAAVALIYDTAGQRTSVTLPNGMVMESGYDAGLRRTSLTYKYGPTTMGMLTYGYDANGQRRQVGGTWARTGLPPALSGATYNAANHQLTFGGQALTYDLNGNLTSDGTSTYTWNPRNQLVSISGPMTAAFLYDGLGRRRQKTIAGTATSFLYDGLNPLQEQGASLANILPGLEIDEFFARIDGGGTRYFLTDGLGSTLALGDEAGAVPTQYTYEPFGATIATGAATANSFDYTGRETDGTGLKYYRARYYHPVLHRFVSEDPIEFAGSDTNLYVYVFNDPTGYIDPFGTSRVRPALPTAEFCLNLGGTPLWGRKRWRDRIMGFITGVYFETACDPNSLFPLPGMVSGPTPGMLKAFANILAKDGRNSLEKALRTLERRLIEHVEKLAQIQRSGGDPGTVEVEINNFRAQITAIKIILGVN